MPLPRRVLVASLAVSAFIQCACLRRQVASELTEQEAREAVVTLSKGGVTACIQTAESTKRGVKQAAVIIQGGDRTQVLAWRILQENGLPRKRDQGLDDLANAPSLIETPEQSKARLLLAFAGELNKTLKSVPGIADARVHLVVPESDPLKEKTESSASVFIEYRDGSTPLQENKIKELVAHGVEGLKPENVAVLMLQIDPEDQPHRNFWAALAPSPEVILDYLPLVCCAMASLIIIAFAGPCLLARVRSIRAKAPLPYTALSMDTTT